MNEARTVAKSETHLYWYMLPFVAVPLVLFFAALYISNTDWFASRPDMVLRANTGYGAKLRNENCEIAVYGDSTALVGVNPQLIQQRTGLTTCNIAEVGFMTMVNDTLLVDDFLKNNPAPRFLVFQFGTDSFNFPARRRYPPLMTFEAVNYRIHQPDKLRNVVELMKHPEDIFTWFEHGMRVAALGLFSKPSPPDRNTIRVRTKGQLVSAEFNTVLLDCSYVTHNDPPRKDWVAALRKKYSRPGTTVLIDATPLPACDPSLPYYRHQLQGLIDNDFAPLPISDFDVAGRHPNAAGSVVMSNAIADQIMEQLKSAAQQGTR